MENENNQMKVEKENNNINNNINNINEPKNENNNNNNEELLKLKKEIIGLKNEQNKYDNKIKEITNIFKNEIDKLKNEIIDLKKELNEVKNKKIKIRNEDNIQNENDINNINNYSDSEDMDYDQTYSLECLSNRLNKEIMRGEERTTIDVVIRNNSNKKYPKDSFLICDNKNSLLLCEKVRLNELEPNQQQAVTIVFKNLKFISKGKYSCIVKLQINNKICNSSFELTIDVLDNENRNYQQNNFQENFVYPRGVFPGGNFGNFNQEQNMNNNLSGPENYSNLIIRFKEQFSLYNSDFSDEIIEQVLKNNNNDFNKAFEALYN